MDSKTIYSTKAEKYTKYRWDYASEAIRTLMDTTQMNATSTVADLGAGTGILTRHFVDKVQRIYAIEPNPELRNILVVAMKAFPSVSVMDGSAENTGLPARSVDAITVAQAIHWFDPEPARKEMLRILKTGGWLALLRNYITTKEKNEALGGLMTEEYGANFAPAERRPQEKPARSYFGGDDFQRLIFPFQFNQNWEEFIGALTTASYMPDEDHPLFGKLEGKAREVFAKFSQQGVWTVEGETELILGQLPGMEIPTLEGA